MKMKQYFFGLAILAAFVGCQPDEFDYPDDLKGEWRIVRSERMGILPDGTIDKFEDLDNAGTLNIFEATPSAESFKEFMMTYTNYQGTLVNLHSDLYTDEDKRRIGFSQVLCNSPFQCDIIWTVDENKKNKQVWSTYGTEDGFFYPPDRYDPTNDDVHLKWRITLEK